MLKCLQYVKTNKASFQVSFLHPSGSVLHVFYLALWPGRLTHMVYTRGCHTMACKLSLVTSICLNIVCSYFQAAPVGVFVTETIWLTKPKLFVIWLFAENVCPSLAYTTGSFGFSHWGTWQEIEGKEKRGVGDLISISRCGCHRMALFLD